jgi:hypothetical protein
MKFTSDNQPANPGRKKGSLNQSTKLLKTATPAILEALIESAKSGDISAINTVLKYSLPTIKPESNRLNLTVPDGATLTEKAELIIDSTLNGGGCPSVASGLINALAQVAKIKEVDEILYRLDQLEKA